MPIFCTRHYVTLCSLWPLVTFCLSCRGLHWRNIPLTGPTPLLDLLDKFVTYELSGSKCSSLLLNRLPCSTKDIPGYSPIRRIHEDKPEGPELLPAYTVEDFVITALHHLPCHTGRAECQPNTYLMAPRAAGTVVIPTIHVRKQRLH